MATVVIGLVLVVAVGAVLGVMAKRKRNAALHGGCSGCTGCSGCSGCSASAGCGIRDEGN